MRRLRSLSLLLTSSAAVALAACGSGTYADTRLPTPQASTTTSSPSPTTTAPACANATQSYDPLTSLPSSSSITDGTMRTILDRGYLIVGVSADTQLLGARNPLSGKIEGFDIDIARAVAERMFGDPGKIRFRVITAATRIPLLESREVDMVARNMTMTCARWDQIAFSSEYYHAGQKVLVARGSTAVTLEDLRGKRVCAPAGTSSLDKLRSVNGPIVVTSDNHTGCLVLFQQGKADAITGDDTVLAGLAAQDPYAVVTDAPAISDEPYGLGFNKEDVYFVRYVNTVLAQLRSDGEWKTIYDTWLAATLGKAPAPPKPIYGRS